MRVLLLHNAVADEASTADRDVLVQAEATSQALAQAGHEPIALPVTLDLGPLEQAILSSGADMVFNLVESLGGSDRLAFLAPAVLDVLGCPYSGSPARALFLLGDKLEAKRRLRSAGLPTPKWVSSAEAARGDSLDFRGEASKNGTVPLGPATRHIIKPRYEHASFGIDSEAVVEACLPRHLATKLAQRERKLGTPCFAERYIEGRELNLSLLAGSQGPEVLPPAEIDFCGFSAEKPNIVDYRAKWDPDSDEYQGTPRRFEFPAADRPLLEELARLARSCWHLFGLQGYARVDFRVDGGGRPWILEINANPCLSPDAGFAAALDRAGISFPEGVERILADAVRPHATISPPDSLLASAGPAAARRPRAAPDRAVAIGADD